MRSHPEPPNPPVPSSPHHPYHRNSLKRNAPSRKALGPSPALHTLSAGYLSTSQECSLLVYQVGVTGPAPQKPWEDEGRPSLCTESYAHGSILIPSSRRPPHFTYLL